MLSTKCIHTSYISNIYVYLGSISSLMQISLNMIDIFCLHIFFWIRSNSRITFIVFGGKLIYVLSIVVCIPSTFCPTLGHHQGSIYYKSDVTFVLAYYYCVRASLPLNQFPPNTIKVIREFERIQKKICTHKMSIMFNEMCI